MHEDGFKILTVFLRILRDLRGEIDQREKINFAI